MTYNRKAVETFAKDRWNKPCDDGWIATRLGNINVSSKALQFGATGPDWEAVFKRDVTGETLWFDNSTTGDVIETDLHGDMLEDCTHYISRCLVQGGVNVPQVSWAGFMVTNLHNRADTKTLAQQVALPQAEQVMKTGMMKIGDVIAYWKGGIYQHMGVRVETDGMSCHTWSRYDTNIPGDDWRLKHEGYVYTLIHFSDDDPAPSGQALLARGWWEATAPSGRWFYYLFPTGRIEWTDVKPFSSAPPPYNPKRSGYWFDTGGTLLIFWTSTGSVEEYEFSALASSYAGTWHYGWVATAISISKVF